MWFWWALVAAILSALSVIYSKRILNNEVSPSVVVFVLFLIVTIFSLPPYLFNPESAVNLKFVIAVIVSAAVFAIAKTLQLTTFKQNNLSSVYPLNSLQPVATFVLSVIFLSEIIKITAFAGIILMAIGIYILNFDNKNKNIFHPFLIFAKSKVSQIYILAVVLSSISSIAEKVAINNTFPQNVYPLAFWENFLLTIFTGAYLLKENKNWKTEIKNNWIHLLIGGALFTMLYFSVMFGIQSGPVSLVSGTKKLEVLFVIIFSFFIFGDKPPKKTYIAAIIMLAAVFLIKL